MKTGMLIVTALSLASTAAMADFVPPDAYGWSRGSANSTYGQWDHFTAAAGPNTPDIGVFNPTGNPINVYDSSGGSVITASGNIYSFTLPMQLHVIAPSYSLPGNQQTQVILQVRTIGTEVLPNSINIGGVAPNQVTELYRLDLGAGGPGGGGFMVDTLYQWTLTGNAASYEIRFNSADNFLSLDRVAVDTFVSPPCYANCDGSAASPMLTANDFQCFLNKFAQGDAYANCDGSTANPVLTANDFQCFLNTFAAGCM